MRYLCIVHVDPDIFGALSDAERAALGRASEAYDQVLTTRGKLVLAEALTGPATAATVRVRAEGTSVTDGRFAETREHVAGFLLVDADDRDEAISLAAGCPMARMGAIEVRPLLFQP
ncbi:YciI family protein [Caulobacter sp. KR2-114]|uniref:YciI family protein n=1 Tax=Caulobacter sp. KR2-114 TaxID=3400912 RepID=UPI003BFCAEA8